MPVGAVRSWLSGHPDEIPVADAGVPHATADDVPAGESSDDWVRWRGFGDDPEPIAVSDVRPGDVLIVDPCRGGLSSHNWDPGTTEKIDDLGDAAQMAYGKRATLRLDPRLLPGIPGPDSEDEIDFSESRLEMWLTERIATAEDLPEWQGEALQRLRSGFRSHPITSDDQDGGGYLVLVEEHEGQAIDVATLDGSDESISCTGAGVTLRRHMDGLGDMAAAFAERLGLSPEFCDDLQLAGRLHDLGKVDLRFQLQLVGGDPVAAAMLDEPLAKSLRNAPRVWRYPRGMRHEIASVALVESNPRVLEGAHDPDLVLHLIATHHGWARPLPPIIADDDPQELRYTHGGHEMETSSDLVDTPLALEAADRFWRLSGRYGHHGLAWLEAIFRLADHRQSEREVG